ncbi:hypothetical protein L1887_22716 [Cichorium endivia]|nr:hypothetical protein L1887_22716 [Cichorium endivia]
MAVPSSKETRAFAKEIFQNVENTISSESNLYRQQEDAAAMLTRKQRIYKRLEADDDDVKDERGGSVSVVDKDVKRFRKRSENQDDMEAGNLKQERRVKQKASRDKSDDSDSDSEEERLRDQIEREELERRLRVEDAARSRKLTEQNLSKREEEEAIRRFNDIGALRKVSRQEYLKKREQKKLEEIKDDIEDEQFLFEGVKLTEAKQCQLRHKKQIYELVKKPSQEDDNVNEYRMPDTYDEEGGVDQEKRFAVAMERYRDSKDGDKMNPFAEQEAWVDQQIRKATLKFGSKKKNQSDDYNFVFEDQIEFIQGQIMRGVNVAKEKEHKRSMAKSAHEKLLADRKTLPVYPYRESLLKAIEDHQVRSMKRARDIRDQLERLLERVEIELVSNPRDLDAINKCITSGYFSHSAKIQKDGCYRSVKHPQTVYIHPSSGLAEVVPRWVVYHELVLTSKEYMRQMEEDHGPCISSFVAVACISWL